MDWQLTPLLLAPLARKDRFILKCKCLKFFKETSKVLVGITFSNEIYSMIYTTKQTTTQAIHFYQVSRNQCQWKSVDFFFNMNVSFIQG